MTVAFAFFVLAWCAQETVVLFNHLDDNKNGQIDLTEFTRFCLEVCATCNTFFFGENALIWKDRHY